MKSLKLEIGGMTCNGCATAIENMLKMRDLVKDSKVDYDSKITKIQLIELIRIDTQEDAEKYRYFGSPQININNKDIDPMAEKITNFKSSGCRLYIYKGSTYEISPKEMIEKALFPKGE